MIKLNRCKTLLASVCMAMLSVSAIAQNKTIAIRYQAPLSGENAQYGMLFSATPQHWRSTTSTNRESRRALRFRSNLKTARATPRKASISHANSDDQSILAVIGDFNSTVSMAAGQVYAQTSSAIFLDGIAPGFRQD